MSMSDRRLVSSRALLGTVAGGALLFAAGSCAFIYDFDQYQPLGSGDTGGGSGQSSASGQGGDTSTTSTSSGNGGGGGCMPAEECGIDPIATDPLEANYGDLTVDDTYVYWVGGNGVKKHDKAPGPASAKVFQEALFINLVAGTQQDNIYIGSSAEILHFKTDESVDPFDSTPPRSIVVQGPEVYWIGRNDNRIHMKNGTNPMVTLDMTGTNPQRIAASDSQGEVYWTYQGANAGEGGIKQLGKPDIATGLFAPSGIAVDKDNVYWVTADGAAHKKAKTGGPTLDAKRDSFLNSTLTSGRITIAGSNIYWLGPDEKTCLPMKMCDCGEECSVVWTAPIATLTPVTMFAKGDWVFHDITSDSIYVYWTADTKAAAVLLRKLAVSP